MLQKKSTYDEVYRSFHWQIPEYYNIGVVAYRAKNEIRKMQDGSTV